MRSLSDQLLELVQVANQNGMYDAADWLQACLWSETAIGLHPANERLQRPVKRSHDETLDASLSEARTVAGMLFKSLFSPTPPDKSKP